MSGNNDSIVLEEEIDPDYVPSEEEVIEYAAWMGMDMEADRDLFWIAREGLMAPLPQNWKPCKSKNNEDVYYFNFATAESSWNHPCDGYYRRLYEEEKKKKEVLKKEESDDVRTKARQDVDLLLGKGTKKKNKSEARSKSGGRSTPDAAPGLSAMEKKALPGIRGKGPLQDPVPARTSLSRDSTPERGRGSSKKEDGSGLVLRPASADAILGGGSRGLGSLSAAPLPSTVAAATLTKSSRSENPELTDSDVSPLKPEPKHFAGGVEEKTDDSKNDRKANKNSRLHSAVAISSDFNSSAQKLASNTTTSVLGGASHGGLKPKAVLGKIGSTIPPSGVADEITCQDKELHRNDSARASTICEHAPDAYEELRIELNRLSLHNAELNDTITELTSDLDKERKKNDVLITSQNLLQTQLSTAREENRNMRSELNREIERRARIEAELKEVTVQCTNAKKENASHLKTIQDLRADIHNLEGEINLSKSSAGSVESPQHSTEVHGPGVEMNRCDPGFRVDALTLVQDQSNTSRSRIVELENLVSKLRFDKESAHDELVETIKGLKMSMRSLSDERDVALQDVERKQRRIKDMEAELSNKPSSSREVVIEGTQKGDADELIRLKAYADSLANKLSVTLVELSTAHQNCEEAHFKMRRLESQVSIRQSELEDAESRLGTLKRHMGELQDRCDNSDMQIKSLTMKLGIEIEEKNRVETLLTSSRDDIKLLQAQINAAERAEMNDLVYCSNRVTGEHDTWKAKINILQSDLSDTLSKLTEKNHEVARLKLELATKEDVIDSLRKESSRAHSADTAEISEALKHHKEDMQDKVREAQMIESSLHTELTSYKRRCKSLEEELLQVQHQVERSVQKENYHTEMLSKKEALVLELELKNSSLHRELNEISLQHSMASSEDAIRFKKLEMELTRCQDDLNFFKGVQASTNVPSSPVIAKDAVEPSSKTSSSIQDELESTLKKNLLLNSELDFAKSRIMGLESELHATREEKEKMYFEHMHSQGEHLNILNTKLAAMLDGSMKDRSELMESKLEVEKCKKQNEALQADIVSHRRDLATADDTTRSLKMHLNNAENAIVELKTTCRTFEDENKSLKGKIELLYVEIASYKRQIEDFDQQVYSLGLDKQRLRDSLEAAFDRMRVDSDCHAPATMATERKQDITAKATMELALQRETEILRLQGEIKILTVQRDALKAEIASKSAECASYVKTIEELNNKNANSASATSLSVGNASMGVTDQQKIEARLFFDTVLGSFRKELESSLREQSEAFDRQGKLKGLNGDWAVKTAAANTTDASGELREALIKIASEHREPFNHHSRKSMEDIKCDGTLDDLREILKNYMEQTAQRRDDVKSYIGSQSSNRAAGKVKYDVDEERKLVQELKEFIKSENDYVRQKQQVLARDRDLWRKQYQHGPNAKSMNEQFRATKKFAGEQLNHRAEKLNEMVHQLREIQQWVVSRDEKLTQSEALLRSHDRLSSSENTPALFFAEMTPILDGTLLDRIDALKHMKAEVDDEISLISLQALDVPAELSTVLPPKPARSPDRPSTYGADGAKSSLKRSDSVTRFDSPLRFERTSSAVMARSGDNLPPSSAVFTSRLGAKSASHNSNKAEINGYSDSLRSSLNAYDLHADWLGNLKKTVSIFGSGAVMRHSYDGPHHGFSHGKVDSAFSYKNSQDNRDTKKISDFLSHSKKMFTQAHETYDENSIPFRHLSEASSLPLKNSMRKSIDIGAAARRRNEVGSATYRI